MAAAVAQATKACILCHPRCNHVLAHTTATMAKNAAGISTVELPECEDAGANECVIDDEEGEEEHIDDDEEYSVGSFVSDDSETHERWPSCDECGKGGVETWPVQEKWKCLDCKYRSGIIEPAPEPSEYCPSQPEPETEPEENLHDENNEDDCDTCVSEPQAKRRRQDDV